MSDYQIEVSDRIATVTLNRPEKKNALTIPQLEAMAPEVAALQDRDDVRVLVLTGNGDSFTSGADLVANAPLIQEGPSGQKRSLDAFHALLRAVWNFEGPTLAAIPGVAVGFGFDLALACDLRVAAQSSRYSQSFSKIALVPDGGSSLTLPMLVGAAKAFELMYMAPLFGADEALRLGIVGEVVPDGELGARTAEIAARLAAGPPLAYRLAKRNLRRGMGMTMDEALDNEHEAQLQCLASSDVMVGIMAWANKTTPEFTGA
ncbi:MAG: enoyl-CoA hydratase/isomerase family protein [Proteobacteria bacterium]|nr:enoyl-CoA hydratase/isomerase family protein [Pseudomonadota bacterium]